MEMPRTARIFSLVALCSGLLGCDHATKLVAERDLGAGRVVTVVPDLLELRYARNHDIAFNALSRWDFPGKSALLAAFGLIVLAAAVAMWIRHRRRSVSRVTVDDVGFAFVVAGAIGNVADRLLRGYVVDFIHVSHWPVFNVADACLVVGLIVLGLSRSRTRAAPA